MKQVWCFLLAGLFLACLAACGSHGASAPAMADGARPGASDPAASGGGEPSYSADADSAAEEEPSNEESGEDPLPQQSTFYVTVGGETFSAAFADNSGAQALKELLKGGDITLQMSDYGGFEKVGPLGQSLPAENSQTTTQAGDIVLYQGDQIVIFYGSNSWSYTRLGRIADLTGWEEALGSGDVAVTFSLQAESSQVPDRTHTDQKG